jgi:hypothetical protein
MVFGAWSTADCLSARLFLEQDLLTEIWSFDVDDAAFDEKNALGLEAFQHHRDPLPGGTNLKSNSVA